jgi:transcription elongation GreA/GreB family factor
MSRAFVKETDAVPDLPDRPVSPHPNLVTAPGLAIIEERVAEFQAALAAARSGEDRAAMAASARELRYWRARRASAQLQPEPADVDRVRFGARISIERQDGRRQSFRIVGEDEADPAAGTLSYMAPLAQALMGRQVGDVVRAGQGEAEIVAIEAG